MTTMIDIVAEGWEAGGKYGWSLKTVAERAGFESPILADDP